MKLTMRGKLRDTGHLHTIIEENIEPKKVTLGEDGLVGIKVDIGPIHTSGNFTGTISLSLSELYFLIGTLEQRKLELLLQSRNSSGTKAS